MNSNDLFSFLDGAPEEPEVDEIEEDLDEQQEPEHDAMQIDRIASPDGGAKRKLDGDAPESRMADQIPPKKPRLASPKPVVVDEFETEAKREVDASAGLTGASVEEGSRLELRHQVITLNGIHCNMNLYRTSYMCLGQASGCGTPRISLRSHFTTCSACQAFPDLQIHTGSFPGGVGARDTEKRECARICAHECREDGCRRVRDCALFGEEAEGYLHQSHKGMCDEPNAVCEQSLTMRV